MVSRCIASGKTTKLWKSTVVLQARGRQHNPAMNATRRLVGVAAVLVAALPTIAIGANPSPIAVRFSIGASEASPRGRAAQVFKQIVETRSKGRAQVESVGYAAAAHDLVPCRGRSRR